MNKDIERGKRLFDVHLKGIPFDHNTNFLDIACGKGEMISYVKSEFRNTALGVDPNTDIGGRVKFEDFKSDIKFDVMYMLKAIHHIVCTKERMIGNEYDFIAKKLYNLLEDDGVIVIVDVQPIGKDNPIYEKTIIHVDLGNLHTIGQWMNFLKRAGFTSFKIKRIDVYDYEFVLEVKK